MNDDICLSEDEMLWHGNHDSPVTQRKESKNMFCPLTFLLKTADKVLKEKTKHNSQSLAHFLQALSEMC